MVLEPARSVITVWGTRDSGLAQHMRPPGFGFPHLPNVSHQSIVPRADSKLQGIALVVLKIEREAEADWYSESPKALSLDNEVRASCLSPRAGSAESHSFPRAQDVQGVAY